MNTRVNSLHLGYALDEETEALLSRWDENVAAEPPLRPIRWHMYIQRYLRSATVAASTQIEGNPLSLEEVDRVLQGDRVEGSPLARQEVINYNNALSAATSLAMAPDFEWSEAVFRMINHQVLRDLPQDRQGRYRDEPITVGGVYQGPDESAVPHLMRALVEWLRESNDHPLVRVALLHLNVVAIHPWLDGNGRTARILSSLELMRSQVSAPELISVEPYLREHQDEYFDRIRTTLGDRYEPERHSATEWVIYYIAASAERLQFEARMQEAWPHDIGTIAGAFTEAGHPLDRGLIALLAAVNPVRTRSVAEVIHRSMPTARSMLSEMTREGWLERRGRTRGAHYAAGPRLLALPLRAPAIVQQHVRAATLGLDSDQ